jgi:hypothetical protein
MSGDRFEARVADWLEDGPDHAPRRLVQAGLDHAAAHPRSRRVIVARRVRREGRLLGMAAVVMVAIGISAAVIPGLRPPAAPSAPGLVVGSESCVERVPGVRFQTKDGDERIEGRIHVCQEIVPDGRVVGELTRRATADLFPADAEHPVGTTNAWGATELRTAQGAWTGAFVATHLGQTGPGLEGRLTWAGLGSGAHHGLVYRATVSTGADGVSLVRGSIDALAGDGAVAGTWCFVSSSVPSMDVPSPAHREALRTCTITSDDARLSGTAVEQRTIDVLPDGSTSDRGSITITSSDGGWTGAFAGTGNWYVPGVIEGQLDGVGAFAGQRAQIWAASEDGMHGVMVVTFNGGR